MGKWEAEHVLISETYVLLNSDFFSNSVSVAIGFRLVMVEFENALHPLYYM